jgi:hypothetical protein
MRMKLRVLGLAVAAGSVPVAAEEYEFKGMLDQQAQYNDNITLRQDKQSVFGYVLTPLVQGAVRSRLMELNARAQGNIRRYDDDRFDCDTYNVGAGGQYQMKTSVFGVNGTYGKNCTYSLQLADNALLNPQSRSENYQISPTWSWDWARNHKLVAEGSYSKSTYTTLGGATATTLSNSEIYTARLTEIHVWSPDLTVLGGLNFSDIRYSGVAASSQNIYGIQVGANYALSPHWSLSVGGGPRWADTRTRGDGVTVVGGSGVTLGYTDNISLTYTGKVDQVSLGYGDSINPSSIGQTVQVRSAFVNYRHDFTQRLALNLSTTYSSSQSIQESGTQGRSFDSSSLTTTAGLAWSMAKEWKLGGTYTYRWQDVGQSGGINTLANGTTDSNLVMLFLNYEWEGIRDSR